MKFKQKMFRLKMFLKITFINILKHYKRKDNYYNGDNFCFNKLNERSQQEVTLFREILKRCSFISMNQLKSQKL